MNRYFSVIILSFLCASIYAQNDNFYKQLSDAAVALTKDKVVYDPSYYTIPYPNGDVPPGRGVCTDVIIRAYRRLGIDLQQKIHEDMKTNFNKYPNIWGLKSPNKNIDHRRVPNQAKFFSRFGTILKILTNSDDYSPGDIVTWNLGKGIGHVGIVTDRKSRDGKRPLIVHNIGSGQVLEDCLFKFQITGHYRYK